jgi:hypothetical protein
MVARGEAMSEKLPTREFFSKLDYHVAYFSKKRKKYSLLNVILSKLNYFCSRKQLLDRIFIILHV